MNKALIFAIAIICSLSLSSQNIVSRNDTVEVFHGTTKLNLPWASGMNSAHIEEIDLNLDGIMDLIAFEPNTEYNEVTGDKIMPFINKGTVNASDYVYAPEYRSNFPRLEGYVILADYNCDGKADIFTHNSLFQTVKVYRNDSDTELKFTKMVENLKTDISTLPTGFGHQGLIYWNYEDKLTIADIDNDGDLDILGIDYIGSYIEYNKNMSMELYGTCDSLAFQIKNTCWGRIAEDFGTITLNTCNPYGNVPNPESTGNPHQPNGSNKGSKHSNTSLLALDLDGDGDKDILTGDGISPYLSAYHNGGTKTNSLITAVDTFFPVSQNVDLLIYTISMYVDVDNDGKRDLIVTPRYDVYQDTNSVWMYKNTGTDVSPVFQKSTHSFLQGDMIDVGRQSRPVFFDYDKDGLLDLVIGNLGYFEAFNITGATYKSSLALYKNTGSLQDPEFTLVDLDFGGLSQLILNTHGNLPGTGLHPTFGDLDYDGDEDMIVGDARGRLHYFENIPVAGKADFHLAQVDMINIKSFGATPQLFDLDDDGKLDLLVGEQYGQIHYYHNSSTSGITFELADDSIGGVNVTDWQDFSGYSVPYFFRDSLNEVKLLAGSKLGFIQLYDSIIVNDTISVLFNLVESDYQNMWDGIYSSVSGGDLNNDKSLDFVVGNQSGGVTLYTSEDSIYIPGFQEFDGNKVTWNLFPNPTNKDLQFQINCNCADQFTYSTFDVMGNKVASVIGGNSIKMNVDALNEGIYFIRVENKNRSIIITERFIKSD